MTPRTIFKRQRSERWSALLQLIDNPYQDIPLASVLRSPIVGLIEPELARIRLADRSHTYYEAVLAYQAEHTDELADKLNHFVNSWRYGAN